jgi:hypothetical protein
MCVMLFAQYSTEGMTSLKECLVVSVRAERNKNALYNSSVVWNPLALIQYMSYTGRRGRAGRGRTVCMGGSVSIFLDFSSRIS